MNTIRASWDEFDRVNSAWVAAHQLYRNEPADIVDIASEAPEILDIAQRINSGEQLFPRAHAYIPGVPIQYFRVTDETTEQLSRMHSTLRSLSERRAELIAQLSR